MERQMLKEHKNSRRTEQEVSSIKSLFHNESNNKPRDNNNNNRGQRNELLEFSVLCLRDISTFIMYVWSV